MISWFPETTNLVSIYGETDEKIDQLPLKIMKLENLKFSEEKFGHFRNQIEEKWIPGNVNFRKIQYFISLLLKNMVFMRRFKPFLPH